jgi:hypothetical protein
MSWNHHETLINPSNPLISIVKIRESRWNRCGAWKPLILVVNLLCWSNATRTASHTRTSRISAAIVGLAVHETAATEVSVLSIEDKHDEVRELIILGKERGYLLYDEVNDLLSEEVCSSDELDSVFSLLGSSGIEVIDSEREFQDGGKREDKSDENSGEDRPFDFGSLIRDKPMIRRVFTSEK